MKQDFLRHSKKRVAQFVNFFSSIHKGMTSDFLWTARQGEMDSDNYDYVDVKTFIHAYKATNNLDKAMKEARFVAKMRHDLYGDVDGIIHKDKVEVLYITDVSAPEEKPQI